MTTRELPVHVRISGVTGSGAGIVVVADVSAAGASWASLMPTGDFREGGVTQRLSDGTVELELGREWFSPDGCEAGVCELDYVVALDAEPTAPWDVTLSVTIDGDGADRADVDIRSAP